MGRGAPPWAQVKLRVAFGAVLQMATGRRYQVVGVRGKALQALVLPPEAAIEPGTEVWNWRWAKREPRAAR